MITDIEILLAAEDDLPVLLELQKRCYMVEARIYNDYTIQPLTQDLESTREEFRSHTIFKAVVNGGIVGSVRGHAIDGTCHVGKLFVDESVQNQGLGSRLLLHLESAFPRCSRFELYTGHRSEKNLHIYHKIGYREFNREVVNEYFSFVFLEKRRP